MMQLNIENWSNNPWNAPVLGGSHWDPWFSDHFSQGELVSSKVIVGVSIRSTALTWVRIEYYLFIYLEYGVDSMREPKLVS
jgi:hypothetical protein